jgi:putative lipoprotein
MNRRISPLAGWLVTLLLTACASKSPSTPAGSPDSPSQPAPSTGGPVGPSNPAAPPPSSETAPPTDTAPSMLTQVTGNVTYRERIALSPDAVLTLEVMELTPEGKPGDILSQQFVTGPGQVPIPFSVAINPQNIRPEASYVLTARIKDGGRTFGTPTPVPVLTQGHRSTDIQVLLRSGS